MEPAIPDISEHTNISVHWEPIKQGRSVVGMRFGCVEEKATAIKPNVHMLNQVLTMKVSG
ncbi:replication initiation protein [Candidatus Arsenophonus triatominarum]|uniref:replication initiation protein n=1 Tax=Candidatus Arsenophonus triatominarum TaxID=57911 RepID=UPI001396A755